MLRCSVPSLPLSSPARWRPVPASCWSAHDMALVIQGKAGLVQVQGSGVQVPCSSYREGWQFHKCLGSSVYFKLQSHSKLSYWQQTKEPAGASGWMKTHLRNTGFVVCFQPSSSGVTKLSKAACFLLYMRYRDHKYSETTTNADVSAQITRPLVQLQGHLGESAFPQLSREILGCFSGH